MMHITAYTHIYYTDRQRNTHTQAGRQRQSAGRLVECCFTFTETVGLLGTGAQDGHLDFHTVPEL